MTISEEWRALQRTAGGPWGPEEVHSVTFGGQVVDDFARGLVRHAEATERPVVLGCVPWFGSNAVADALHQQAAVCVVIDKRGTHHWVKVVDEQGTFQGWEKVLNKAVLRVHFGAQPVQQSYLTGFELVLPRADGQAQLVGPGGPLDDENEFGPIRVVGWSGYKGDPLLHAKLAVCCEMDTVEMFGREERRLSPIRAWVGSANWTEKASEHVEVGVWIGDQNFAHRALQFLLNVIRASEPLSDFPPRMPTPEFAEAEIDDAAMAEYLVERGYRAEDE
jgi:hypothetical protein